MTNKCVRCGTLLYAYTIDRGGLCWRCAHEASVPSPSVEAVPEPQETASTPGSAGAARAESRPLTDDDVFTALKTLIEPSSCDAAKYLHAVGIVKEGSAILQAKLDRFTGLASMIHVVLSSWYNRPDYLNTSAFMALMIEIEKVEKGASPRWKDWVNDPNGGFEDTSFTITVSAEPTDRARSEPVPSENKRGSETTGSSSVEQEAEASFGYTESGVIFRDEG